MKKAIQIGFVLFSTLGLLGGLHAWVSASPDAPVPRLLGATFDWTSTPLDAAGDVGQHASLALQHRAGTALGVAYYDNTGGDLKYAYFDGAAWVTATIDSAGNVGQYAALAYTPRTGEPAIAYYDVTNQDLKFAAHSTLFWSKVAVDSAGSVGQHVSLAIAAGVPNTPCISYQAAGKLKYAYFDSAATRWVSETVDAAGTTGLYTALALEPAAPYRPRISYYDSTLRQLHYAYLTGSGWVTETVDSSSPTIGQYTALDLAATSPYTPHIAYYDNINQTLKHAYRGAGGWVSETVANVGDSGDSALALDAQNQPYLTYAGTNGTLQLAYWANAGWNYETVDGAYGAGGASSLAIDSGGRLHVAYDDWNLMDLRYAQGNRPCTAVTAVTLVGPASVTTGTLQAFTANVSPALPDLPIDFTWEATEQSAVISTTNTTSHSAAFAWLTPGDKTITVTAANCGASVQHTLTVTVNGTDLFNVPLDVYRRAAAHLELTRLAEPRWAQAYLHPDVRPLYRPDVAGVAYYEFRVLAPSLALAGLEGPQAQSAAAAGFIMVSTGEHDYPIPNWAPAGQSPTERLEAAAAAQGKTAVRFYKLDSLAYAAEDALGQRAATDGQQPPKITGLPADWQTLTPTLSSVDWVPDLPITTDEGLSAVVISYTQVISGPTMSPLHLEPWSSWDELKGGFAATYAPFVEDMRRGAGEAWLVENMARQYGWTLFKGETRAAPLLWPSPALSVSGPGTALAETEIISRPGLLPVLKVHVLGTLPGQGVPLTITVAYANGVEERLLISIVDRPQVFLPLVTGGTDAAASALGVELQEAGPGTLDQDGYTYWLVGTDADQCWYEQFDTAYTLGTCKSGCGPTAWAMLACWADRKAASGTNTTWAGRWGLYRWNGGRGEDAVAPNAWGDPNIGGVKNMILEINEDVGTWCVSDSGATNPWDMDQVHYYFNGRSGVTISTRYNALGFDPTGSIVQEIRTYARNVIKNLGDSQRPSVIGTGFLSHYPLAYGYRSKTVQNCWTQYDWEGPHTSCMSALLQDFYVNQGWGGYGGEWVSADIWFAGRLTPHQSWVNDVAVYRTSNRYWYYDYEHSGNVDLTQSPWGWPNNLRPVVGDFDRDKVVDDLGAYIYQHDTHQGEWRFDFNHDHSGDGFLPMWGTNASTARPIALDYDRDGYVDDLGLFRSAQGYWNYDLDATGSQDAIVGPWGLLGDLPVSGDFDSDGFWDDVGVYRPSNGFWYFDLDHDGDLDTYTGSPGLAEDLPVAGDFDKDGYVDDVGLYRPSDQKWRFDYNRNGTIDATTGPFGLPGDLPLAGNFDTE